MSSANPHPTEPQTENNPPPAHDRKEVFDEKPAGHQPEEQKDENFEPGVEG